MGMMWGQVLCVLLFCKPITKATAVWGEDSNLEMADIDTSGNCDLTVQGDGRSIDGHFSVRVGDVNSNWLMHDTPPQRTHRRHRPHQMKTVNQPISAMVGSVVVSSCGVVWCCRVVWCGVAVSRGVVESVCLSVCLSVRHTCAPV